MDAAVIEYGIDVIDDADDVEPVRSAAAAGYESDGAADDMSATKGASDRCADDGRVRAGALVRTIPFVANVRPAIRCMPIRSK